jgi:hypothetical protein
MKCGWRVKQGLMPWKQATKAVGPSCKPYHVAVGLSELKNPFHKTGIQMTDD